MTVSGRDRCHQNPTFQSEGYRQKTPEDIQITQILRSGQINKSVFRTLIDPRKIYYYLL